MGKFKELVMEPQNSTTVINLFGGPSTGKSTLQSEIYAYLKKKNKSVEMVREVAKKWAWAKKDITALDQLNIIGEQIKDESELYGKVDYIITDSPILLGAFYMNFNHNQMFMANMVKDYMKFAKSHGISYKNFILSRKYIGYDLKGRYQKFDEIANLDEQLQGFLVDSGLKFDHIDGYPDNRIYRIIDLLINEKTCGYCEDPCNNDHCVTKN